MIAVLISEAHVSTFQVSNTKCDLYTVFNERLMHYAWPESVTHLIKDTFKSPITSLKE